MSYIGKTEKYHFILDREEIAKALIPFVMKSLAEHGVDARGCVPDLETLQFNDDDNVSLDYVLPQTVNNFSGDFESVDDQYLEEFGPSLVKEDNEAPTG